MAGVHREVARPGTVERRVEALVGVVRVLPVVHPSDRGGVAVGTQTGVVLAEGEDSRGDHPAELITIRAGLTPGQARRGEPGVEERPLRRV